MNLSYYTVDDLRLGHDPKGVVGWRMSHFLSLDDALTHYASLSATGVKSLGLTDGVHCLEIARCVPLFEYDREGEDILASDYKQFPLWADVEESILQHRHVFPPCGFGMSSILMRLYQFQKVTPYLQN